MKIYNELSLNNAINSFSCSLRAAIFIGNFDKAITLLHSKDVNAVTQLEQLFKNVIDNRKNLKVSKRGSRSPVQRKGSPLQRGGRGQAIHRKSLIREYFHHLNIHIFV